MAPSTAAHAADLLQACREIGWRLCCAESCTGGLLSAMITSVQGCSDVFMGSVVAYHNETKISQLGVAHATLERFGAVSPQTAEEMAVGVRRVLLKGRSGLALSVTGVAGPLASESKPAGLVHLCVTDGARIHHLCETFQGDRQAVQSQAVCRALMLGLALCGDRT